MRLPDFLIIGAAKSGTTTLYEYLRNHPQVYSSEDTNLPFRVKEPNFFGDNNNYRQGLELYSSLFAGAKSDQICGEASTDYAKWPLFPECAKRIYEAIPKVKLIYIMRNPVERAFSHYVHLSSRTQKFEGFEGSFEDYMLKTSVCLDTSKYILQIEQYLKFFPKESFLFLLTEDLKNNPSQSLRQVCQFLNIDHDINLTQTGQIVANQAQTDLEGKLRTKIMEPFKKLPGISLITKNIPDHWRDKVYKFISNTQYGKVLQESYQPPKISPGTYEVLLNEFNEPNQKLADFINRDLSHWSSQENIRICN